MAYETLETPERRYDVRDYRPAYETRPAPRQWAATPAFAELRPRNRIAANLIMFVSGALAFGLVQALVIIGFSVGHG